MNRRAFLKRMSAAGLVLASPKLIFDLAANTYKTELMVREFRTPSYNIVTIQATAEYKELYNAIVKNFYLPS